MWSDEAIDRLLDRSDLANPAAAAAAGEEAEGGGRGDILAAFKVAHFQLERQPSSSAAAKGDGGAAGEAQGGPFDAAAFWRGLLAGRAAAAAAAAAQAELGKGKRSRRTVLDAQRLLDQDARLDALLSDDSGDDVSGSDGGGSSKGERLPC